MFSIHRRVRCAQEPIFVALLCVALSQSAFAQGFFPGSRVPLPEFASGTSLGDLDGDGKLDIVSAGSGSQFHFLRGDALGAFQAAIAFPLSHPTFAAMETSILDLDADAHPDIAVIGHCFEASSLVDEIHVKLGAPGGSLGPDVVTTLPYSQTFGFGVFGDFDGDGWSDYAFYHAGGSEILLARGTGSGAFGPPQSIAPAASAVASLTAGDVDIDHDLDLLLFDYATVALLTNDGGGGFAPATVVGGPLATNEIALADVDEDSQPDIAFGSNSVPYGAWYLKGLGAGAFAAPAQLFATPDPFQSVAAVDLDRDGHLELIGSMNGVAVARGLGGGTYGSPTSYPSANTGLIGTGDVDGDGHVDLVLGGQTSEEPTTLTLLAGDGAGSLVSVDGYEVRGAHAADFDLDGRPDLVGAASGQTSVGIQYGTPAGTFGPMQTFNVGAFVEELAIGDLDLDGRPDVLTTSGAPGVHVLLGAPNGGLGPPAAYGLSYPEHPTIGDVTGDGLPDAVFGEATWFNGHVFIFGDEIRVMAGDGAGGLGAPTSYLLGGNSMGYPTIGDLDGDGRSDVVVSHSSGVLVLLGRADGTLSAPYSASTICCFLSWPSLVDLDSDGDLDYLASSGSSEVYALMGDGLGSFTSVTTLPTLLGLARPVATADVDGNGRVDVVCGGQGGFEVFLQESSGAFAAPRAYSCPVNSADYNPEELCVRDIDGDGRLDVLAAESVEYGPVRVSRNIGPAPRVGVYCSAKVNSHGCTPRLSFSGAPSASQSSGFVISATDVVNRKLGLFFYGLVGSNSEPFFSGRLCVLSPLRRTPATTSGGSNPPLSDCSGVMSIDMNAFAAGALGGNPDPLLSVAGTHVHCQMLARDAGVASYRVQLSEGAQYFVGP